MLIVATLVGVATPVRAAPDCSKAEAHERKTHKADAMVAMADCHKKAGQYALAWAEYKEAAQRARAARDAKSQKAADRGVKETEAKVAFITISGEGSPTDVRIDTVPAHLGVATPLDPGVHVVSSGAWSRKLSLRSGDTESVVIPKPEAVATAEPTPAAPAAPPPAVEADLAPKPATSGADKPTESAMAPHAAPEDEHVGLVADVEMLAELYDEVGPASPAPDSGHAIVTVATVGYDFTPALRAFGRFGLVDNDPPGRDSALSASNLALGGLFTFSPFSPLKIGFEAGTVLPVGSGVGASPVLGLALANVRARALYPTLFDPNYLSLWGGVNASATISGVVVRGDAAVDESIRTAGEAINPDSTKTRLRLGFHGGYLVIPQIEPFVELRWIRFLSEPAFVKADSALADNLFGMIGVGLNLQPVRAQLGYLRALDAPLVRDGFSAFVARVGVDF